MAQHLQAVHAATQVGQAKISGDKQGSSALSFEPTQVQSGNFDLRIGTAGSTPLVLQTILVPLSLIGDTSVVTISGGTHVRWSPCFHYLDCHWHTFMQRAGYNFQLKLNKAGFYPRGGGSIQATIEAAKPLRPLELLERGSLKSIQGLSAVANLSMDIAKRQRHQAFQRLMGLGCGLNINLKQLSSPGRGTLLLLLAHYEHTQCCFYALGERGKPAERVADEAVDQLLAFDASGGAIDHYLADQLILPLAVVDGTSRLHSARISNHLITNAEIVRHFLPVDIHIQGERGEAGIIEIRGHHP